MKLLIDADLISYRAGFATDKTKYAVLSPEIGAWTLWDDAKAAKEHVAKCGGFLWSRKDPEPEDKALMLVDIMLQEIKDRYASEKPSLALYLTGIGNFRHSIATRANYKGNRAGSVPPCHLRAIRDHLVNKYNASLSSDREADDDIGIAMTANPGSVCVSIDKDLMQLPGRHYNFVTKEETIVYPRDASLSLYAQMLSGDATDNIPGLTGVGPVKARKLLADCKNTADCWQVVVAAYKAEFGEKGFIYAMEVASLVYVLREEGRHFTTPTMPPVSSGLSSVAA